jgi:hypothetical protein
MSNWVDVYVVEDAEGQWYEVFSDEVMAAEYCLSVNNNLRQNSPPVLVRHTIVDIED